MADFLSENSPNQFLYRCLKANTDLPEETILAAFNEAYTICIDVLAAPDIHTSRSANFSTLASRASRASLLAHCFVYFLLSFHEKAPELRDYLANLAEALEQAMSDIFTPIKMSAITLSPLYPATVTFKPSSAAAVEEQPALNESKQYVKIRNIILRAEQLPNHEATTVLETVRVAIADERSDWDTILAYEIDKVRNRPEPAYGQSRFRIRDKHLTGFLKVVRALADYKVFQDDKGLVCTYENVASALCLFFNAHPKSVHGVLSEAKKTQSYMEFFYELEDVAEAFYKDKDGVDQPKPTINNRSRNPKLFDDQT